MAGGGRCREWRPSCTDHQHPPGKVTTVQKKEPARETAPRSFEPAPCWAASEYPAGRERAAQSPLSGEPGTGTARPVFSWDGALGPAPFPTFPVTHRLAPRLVRACWRSFPRVSDSTSPELPACTPPLPHCSEPDSGVRHPLSLSLCETLPGSEQTMALTLTAGLVRQGRPRLGFREPQAQEGRQRTGGGACPTPGFPKLSGSPAGGPGPRTPLERLPGLSGTYLRSRPRRSSRRRTPGSPRRAWPPPARWFCCSRCPLCLSSSSPARPRLWREEGGVLPGSEMLRRRELGGGCGEPLVDSAVASPGG